MSRIREFQEKVAKLDREDIIDLIRAQDVDLVKQINRIEWVFKNKLTHLTWSDGSPVEERPLTNEELALVLDPPFSPSDDLRAMGLNIDQQRQIHIASDPVLWAKHFLNATPRVYQILMLRHPSIRKVLRAGRRLGKALDVSTPIPTPNGWKTMGDLQEGDQVFDENGSPCNVTFATEYQHGRQCYEVKFSDGSSLIADADHQWTVDTRKSRKARNRAINPKSRPVTLTTAEMIDDLYVQNGSKMEVNYSIDNADPVAYPEKDLILDPWLFGLWLGDGTCNSGVITIGHQDQEEILQRIKAAGFKYHKTSARGDNEFRVDNLWHNLNKLAVLRKYRSYSQENDKWYEDNNIHKHIPRDYLQASIPQREALLKGLMDSDGTVAENGNCEFSVCNEHLAKDVYELVQSLGYRATWKSGPAKLNGRVTGIRYRINWTPWRPVFSLERKLKRQKITDAPSARQRCRYIVSISPVQTRPVKCITVDSSSSLYLAGENFIPTHNTYTMALMVLHYAYTHKNGRILVMAPMKPQVGLIYEEVMKLAKNSDAVLDSITRSVTSPQYEIHFSNGSTVRFFTTGLRSGGKCLTPDHDVLTKDEGWKPIADVGAGEIVASWDNGQLVWAEAAAAWSYDYKGKMLEHQGRQLSFKVTPNHKFKVRSTNQGSPYRWIQATEMKGDLNIPAAGKPLPTETDKYSGAELEMWGWWLSEGSGFDSNMARISQVKPHGRKRITEVAQELGVHYTEYEREIRVAWKPPEFSGTNAYDKFIPRFLLTEKHRDRLLRGLLEGDGWMRRKGWEYSSSSHALAEAVHELALMMGLRTTIKEKNINYKPVGGGAPNRHWIVSAYPYETYTTSREETGRMRWVDYDGPVHCITVPQTGTFVTRRNGVVHVTGNSDVARGQEAHLIILDELDYMGPDDLDALYAMLQKTDDNQPDKILVGASTPTGRRERFWEWSRSPRFKEFWFPSYANPYFDKKIEEEMRAQYNEMAYRHEIEADWGEDVEGVYPRRYVDAAFAVADWQYIEGRISARSEHLIGVDWDKYGAGPNIVVLEMCNEDYEDDRFASKLRVAYREEIPRNEYVLTQAVERIIELNAIFNPRHIYVDRGYGDCVDPNTLITARHGMVPIKDIEPGHEVLSHDGDWHKVTGKIVRKDPKDTFEVKVAKSLPVRVSDTHPFLCLTSDGLTEWKNVTEMQIGDYVALPKLSIVPEDSVIDIAQYMAIPDREYDDEYVWSHNSNGNRIRIKRFVDLLSEDFLRFAGWYLSEGSSSGVQVEISQIASFDPVDLMRSIEQVVGIAPSECIRIDSRETHYQDIRRIWITSKVFANFIGKLLGKGSVNKKIPNEMMAHPYLLGPLLNGVFQGDGHLYKTNSNYGYELSLTSFKLVDQIKLILNSVDIPVSSHFIHKRNDSHSDQLKIVFSGCPEDTVRFMSYTGLDVPNPERISRKSWKSDSEYLFLPIRKIDYIGKQTGLIDIEVEGAESFVGNGLILHNTQVELLAKYGVEHPQSGIKKKLKGVSFAQMIEMKDPATKQTIKKEMKPFMVDNLRTLLEAGQIVFPEHDEELYLQLISYVVLRTTAAGRPVFEASGSQVDHAHDALILACLAYTQNYGDLMKVNLATRARSISNEALLPMFEPPKGLDVEKISSDQPIRRTRSGIPKKRRSRAQRPIQRKTF